MTAEVRRHIVRERDRIVRRSLRSAHVLYCTMCGDPYDVKRVSKTSRCLSCRRES